MKLNWKQVGFAAAAGALVAVASHWLLNPDPIDYVNVALVPEIAEDIGADLPTRLELARIGFRTLDAVKGPPGTALKAGNFADEYGRSALERHGQRAFDVLTVEQRQRFFKMFRARDIVPVTYETKPNPNGNGPAVFTLTFGWKHRPDSTEDSLGAIAEKLDLAWRSIPSRQVAETLLKDGSPAVKRAAKKWLRKNAPDDVAIDGVDSLVASSSFDSKPRLASTTSEHELRRKRPAQQLYAADTPLDYSLRAEQALRAYEARAAELRRIQEGSASLDYFDASTRDAHVVVD